MLSLSLQRSPALQDLESVLAEVEPGWPGARVLVQDGPSHPRWPRNSRRGHGE